MKLYIYKNGHLLAKADKQYFITENAVVELTEMVNLTGLTEASFDGSIALVMQSALQLTANARPLPSEEISTLNLLIEEKIADFD